VDANGNISYDSSLETILSGQGTDTLSVHGHSIQLDTTAVAATSFNLRRYDSSLNTIVNLAVLNNTGNRTLGLMPSNDYQVCAPTSANCVGFTITEAGLVEYDSALEGRLQGKGTTTLIVSDPTTILYVDAAAPSGGDGLTAETAFNSLAAALAAVEASNGTITDLVIAEGTYAVD